VAYCRISRGAPHASVLAPELFFGGRGMSQGLPCYGNGDYLGQSFIEPLDHTVGLRQARPVEAMLDVEAD